MGEDDPRIDWGPGEWLEETQRLEDREAALRERLREEVEWLRSEAKAQEAKARPYDMVPRGKCIAYAYAANRLADLLEEGGE